MLQAINYVWLILKKNDNFVRRQRVIYIVYFCDRCVLLSEIFRPRRLNSVQLQSQQHGVHSNLYNIFLSFQTLFTVQDVVLFHHTRFDIGVRVEWKLGWSYQLTGHCPVRVELELHVVRQQRGSHLGKEAVWQVIKTNPLFNQHAPGIDIPVQYESASQRRI